MKAIRTGRASTRKIPLKGFRVVFLHLIPLSQASCRNLIRRSKIHSRTTCVGTDTSGLLRNNVGLESIIKFLSKSRQTSKFPKSAENDPISETEIEPRLPIPFLGMEASLTGRRRKVAKVCVGAEQQSNVIWDAFLC